MGISERTVEKHLAKAIERLVRGAAGKERGGRGHEDISEIGSDGTRVKHD